ncbi:FecR family protein [Methylobacillus gramineus]|uniref:FecR family protein n=1 Tax=Methylobacillus gramineus TaxID=755169 RepID=UPI001D000E96|nr:FecR family protein [Methylobacillus gramineus]MCB5185760.1 FecR family protein [Methylobacillus gramineus]
MTSSSHIPSIIEQAAQWHAHMHSGQASAAEQEEFEQWRHVDMKHAEAYARMEKLWSSFDHVQDVPGKATLNAVIKPARRKRVKTAASILSVLIVVVIAGLTAHTQPARVMMADYSTGIGEQRVIQLADSSLITLDTHSAVNVDFSAGQRQVELLQGKMLIQVAKDKQRPFIVETAEGMARALGTQYAVRRQRKVTQVTVLESSVEACNLQRACVTLQPGDSTRLQQELAVSKAQVDLQTEMAWTQFKLVADDMPLADVLREVQRYHRGHLYFNAEAMAHIHVSGVFALNDTARTLKVLADTTSVSMTQYTPWLTMIKVDK